MTAVNQNLKFIQIYKINQKMRKIKKYPKSEKMTNMIEVNFLI